MLSFGRIKDDDDDNDAPESFDHINSKLNIPQFSLRCLATSPPNTYAYVNVDEKIKVNIGS